MFEDENEWTTDYSDRCGNCHEYFDKKDKYCKNCGTKRGEGKFEAFKNEMYCVYGPPIKKKYRCSNCDHMWITCHLGGMDSSNYCPQCGEKQVKLIDNTILDFSDHVGMEEPYDPQHPPTLMTEEQLKNLLRQRNGYNRFRDHELVVKMKKAGVIVQDLPDTDWDSRYYRTETEAEQMNLAAKVLALKGNDLDAFPEVTCKRCGSRFVAALTYKSVENKQLSENVMLAETDSPSPIVLHTNYAYRIGNSQSAFLCLQCGKEFVL